MGHIRETYGITTHKKIRESWDNWYLNTAPREDEDVNQYVERMREAGSIVIESILPMKTIIFSKKTINTEANWKIDHLLNEKLDPTFEWPESLQAAMNSVTSRFNPNPKMPRLDGVRDIQLHTFMQDFNNRVENFYQEIQKKTKVLLEYMAHRRVLYACEVSSTLGDKPQLVEKMKTWGRYFMSVVFRPPNTMSMNVLDYNFNFVYSATEGCRHKLIKVANYIHAT